MCQQQDSGICGPIACWLGVATSLITLIGTFAALAPKLVVHPKQAVNETEPEKRAASIAAPTTVIELQRAASPPARQQQPPQPVQKRTVVKRNTPQPAFTNQHDAPAP